jgi:biotin synthase
MVEALRKNRDLSDEQLKTLLETGAYDAELTAAADAARRENYGTDVYIRGLIEFTNYCKNDCYYCGLRRGNKKLARYRLEKAQILQCCADGHALGFRTFVLQGGEDPYYDDARLCGIVASIRAAHPDCAITLSVGERSYDAYKRLFDAGANRYLLRHETACAAHYRRLHPEEMLLSSRKECLWNLKEIGYQVGSGFMVGSPFQTAENLIADLRFLQELQPEMLGIGPFIKHQDTPFAQYENGALPLCLRLVSILRLLFPAALIPATTALGTISPIGRELGLKAGANVVMPNLSPASVRKLYALYDDKICTGEEAAECRWCLDRRVLQAGYRIVVDRGDAKAFRDKR